MCVSVCECVCECVCVDVHVVCEGHNDLVVLHLGIGGD